MMLYVIGEAELPDPLPEHDVAIVIASDSEDCRDALRKIDAAAPHWPRPLLNPPHLVSAASTATSCIGCSTASTASKFRRRWSVTRERLADAAQSPERACRHRHRSRLSRHHPPARLACRVRALPGSTMRQALAAYLEAEQGRAVLRLALRRLLQRRRPVPQIPRRLRRRPALCLPHGDRRPLGHLVPQRRHGAQRREAPRGRDLHAHLRHRLRPPASGRAERAGRARRAGIFHHRLRRNQRRRAADLRGRQHRRRPQHGSASVFPYKPPQMRKIFDAFAAMLVRHAHARRERAA